MARSDLMTSVEQVLSVVSSIRSFCVEARKTTDLRITGLVLGLEVILVRWYMCNWTVYLGDWRDYLQDA